MREFRTSGSVGALGEQSPRATRRNRRRGKDRMHFFRIAAGSAAEVLAGLDIAAAWGYVGEPAAEPARQLLDRLLAICWRLTERGGPRRAKATS